MILTIVLQKMVCLGAVGEGLGPRDKIGASTVMKEER